MRHTQTDRHMCERQKAKVHERSETSDKEAETKKEGRGEKKREKKIH